jgi:two-component system cell cycle response regulator DivK
MSENLKILIVDDNALNVKLCCAILKDRYQVFTAATAEEGLNSARRILPDLILMDIQLPGMDGLAATRVIKSEDALKTIPVIALTSFAMVGDREKALSAGCDEYFPKPIDIKGLKAMVARFLGNGAARRGECRIGQRPSRGPADPVLS